MLATTAARVGGIAGLRLSDLDLDHRRATVHEKGRGGNNKDRLIFLRPAVVDALRTYLDHRPPSADDHVFLAAGLGRHKSLGWHRLNENGIYQALERIAAAAHIKTGFNPHSFRHAAIRGWLDNGMPLSKASELAGHSSTRVTGDIYGTSNDDELQSALDRYTWID